MTEGVGRVQAMEEINGDGEWVLVGVARAARAARAVVAGRRSSGGELWTRQTL